jgi:cysteinyl-tRNA synthetase
LSSLQDDLNSPIALSFLSGSAVMASEKGVSTKYLTDFINLIETADKLFGFRLMGENDIKSEQKELIAKREEARKNKDWAGSDKIREELEKQSIEVRDTEHGPIWSRI